MLNKVEKKAIKNLQERYKSMLNPISVSLNKFQVPMLGQSQVAGSLVLNGLRADTFEHAKSVTNVSFTSVDNSIVGQSIRDLGDVPCPYCGIKLINGKEISHLNQNTLGGKSKTAVSYLSKFEDRMHPVEKQVFGIIKDLSKKNPNKNVRELLDTVRPQHLENVKNMEFDTLNKMSNYIDKNVSNENDNTKLKNLVNEATGIIQKQDENYIFRRRRFMEKFDLIAKNMEDKESATALKNIAEELPKAQDHVSTFIVKYTQKDPKTKKEKTPYQIGIALVEPSVGSLEHIVPRHPQDNSKGGENKYSNYIYASREWNTKRKNMPLDQWVQQNPEIKDNMQRYMDAVIEKINKGQAMRRCKVYPIIVAETLEKESKGLIKLDTSKLKLSKAQIKAEKARVEAEERAESAKKCNNNSKNNKHISVVA